MSVGHSIIVNFIWRFFERFGARLVSLVVSIVLARLLMPEDYGLVALVSVFINILQVFVENGIGTALVREKDADSIDFSTAFYFNIILSIILYLIIFISSTYIADFYNNKKITDLVRVLGLVVVIAAPKNIFESYIARNMLFKKFFFATLTGTIGAAIVGITMACYGFGVWALVCQHLFNLTVDTIVLWFIAGWKPKKEFSLTKLKSLNSYSWKILLSVLIDKIYIELTSFIIGKKYTPSDLAFFNRGQHFPRLIAQNINSSLDSILLPALANVQDDTTKIKAMVKRSIKVGSYLMLPLMFGLAACAVPIVRILLTDKWLPCVPFIHVFCFAFVLYPIQTTNLNAIKALGKSELFLKLCLIQKSIGIIITIITMNYSVKAMAYGFLLSLILSLFINLFPNKKLLNYSLQEQILDFLPQFLLALFMAITVFQLSHLKYNDYIILLIQSLTGSIIYICGSIIFKIDSLFYIINLVKGFYKKNI